MQLIHGDCLEVMRGMADNSVDAVVCDPPYGLSKEPKIEEVLTHWLAGDSYTHKGAGFMGKTWDSFVPGPEYWRECYRVMKPGAYILVFSSSRTFDLQAIALRIAGFEQHPFLCWIFAQGFPKATNLGKMIDKAAGAEREVVGQYDTRGIQEASKSGPNSSGIGVDGNTDFISGMAKRLVNITAPATEAAKKWHGYFYGKQSLKPAMEPILMFQKPFEKGLKKYESILKWGVGAVNVDGCRVGTRENEPQYRPASANGIGNGKPCYGTRSIQEAEYTQGRWPANVCHSGEECVVGLFPETKTGSIKPYKHGGKSMFGIDGEHGYTITSSHTGDTGSAARFFKTCPPDEEQARLFYCSKASKKDRNEGLPEGTTSTHPTVKPTALMRWLVRLVTPPGGTVLDPFMGSGSTGKAAVLEGFDFVGIELDADYMQIAEARIKQAHTGQPFTP